MSYMHFFSSPEIMFDYIDFCKEMKANPNEVHTINAYFNQKFKGELGEL